MRRATRVGAVIAVLSAAIAVLTGCVSLQPGPVEVEWDLVAKGDIIAMNSTTGVYVSGRMYYGGGGRVESRGVIDYQYARAVKTGGIREDLVSTTYNRFSSFTDYPGSEVVTIFEDATTEGDGARIEVYECAANGTHCTMPDGSRLRGRLRVDVHVPAGSVVQTFDSDSSTSSQGESSPPALKEN